MVYSPLFFVAFLLDCLDLGVRGSFRNVVAIIKKDLTKTL